jgi:Uma2 family endonuclease
MSTTRIKGLSVETHDRMVACGILPETNRFELIEGRIVEKEVKRPTHTIGTLLTADVIRSVVPAGWHVRAEQTVRVPGRWSEPGPDISVVRGSPRDYNGSHPGPVDVALVVEITRLSPAKDRMLARVYAAGGIPVYWIVNVWRRQLEVYANPTGGAYRAPTFLNESDSVDLVIAGQLAGRIAVADLLP